MRRLCENAKQTRDPFSFFNLVFAYSLAAAQIFPLITQMSSL